MSEKAAKFRLKEYKILNSILSIKDQSSVRKEISVKFLHSESLREEDLMFEFYLEVQIQNQDDSLNINVKLKGIFEFDNDITESERSIFFNSSAPAILFPYIRAYISTLTALSGIDTLILPTLNLMQHK